MDELDLEHGDPLAGEPESYASRRRRRRRETGSGGGNNGNDSGGRSSGSSSGSSEKNDRALGAQLDEVFSDLADAREAAGDDELAIALREEAHKMSQGLVAATRYVPFLRYPLLIILSILIPLLAFARIGRILVRRWYERRSRIAAENEAMVYVSEPEPANPNTMSPEAESMIQ